jgi:hypothetical protein
VEPPAPPAAPADAPPLSFFEYMIHSAFAEEVIAATTTPTVGTSSPIQLLSTTDTSSTTSDNTVATNTLRADTGIVTATTSPYGLVEVVYSFDEITWKSLGYVEHDEFDSKKFEIPVDEITGWEDVSNIHIGVRSVPTFDAVGPIIYLDAVWLEVEYEKVGEDPHPAPSLLRGDTYLREVAYGDAVAVLVRRPIMNDVPVYTFSTSSTSTSEVLVYADATTTTDSIDDDHITELWLHNNVEKRWLFIADRKQVSDDSRVFFDYGNVFWTGKDGALWKYNVSSNSFESVSPNLDGTVMVEFRDESSGLKKLILENGTTSPLFQDVVETSLPE